MANIQALTMRNAERWAKAKLTRDSEFTPVAKRLLSCKARYQKIEAKTGVPWFVIAVIHQREASQDFTKSIAQGDPWNKKSVHEPKGRGPFKSFEAAAVDALTDCAPRAAKWKDWSTGGSLTLLEQYNGTGYANKGLPSPYIWSGTDQYVKGKYVADHEFDPNVVDKQLGCAGLILAMQKMDPSIQFAGYASIVPPPPDVEPVPIPKPKPKLDATKVGGASVVVGGSAVIAANSGLPWWAVALVVLAAAGCTYFLFKKG